MQVGLLEGETEYLVNQLDGSDCWAGYVSGETV